ncbi:hypothetical protein DFP91_2763 [Pseudorhodoplanes sinuspersici]|nr:hypothetical protein DFP91_2763 [Pseudorhodoplanes sinuspersici]
MARGQAQAETSAKTRRRNGSAQRRRRKTSPSRARGIMREAVADDVAAMRAEIDDMIASLEAKIDRLNRISKRGAAHAAEGASDIMLNAISGLTDQVSGRMQDTARSASDEVTKFGNQALRRIVSEIDHRPFLTLAIAAGIGFIAGLARPRE